MCTLTIEKRK